MAGSMGESLMRGITKRINAVIFESALRSSTYDSPKHAPDFLGVKFLL
jgi:hypothetical protein